MKYAAIFIIFLCLFFAPALPKVSAQKPSVSANNLFGIHILSENDLNDAAELVNSNGGEWGYVTLVIREDERDVNRWTNAFNKMRELKLIPIVRIATTMQPEGGWRKPTSDQAIPWVDFLDALPWPTKQRHVVLFNEPNHAKEWGGSIEPEEFAFISRHYWEEFKKSNPDYFVLPGALDLAAPNGSQTMNATTFFERMYQADKLIFTIFDGWNSHSYPNPGFSGSPNDTGKMSIRGFKWEIAHLQQYDLLPNTPVFITETGWKHNSSVVENYITAFEQAWTHPNLRAVTPFLLNYSQPPFDIFSWKDPVTNVYRPQYETIKNIPKVAGTPEV